MRPDRAGGLPDVVAFGTIMLVVLVVLTAILFNGKAGITREKDEVPKKSELARLAGRLEAGKSMAAGTAIAVIGGLLATGFSLANAVGRPQIHVAEGV